MDMEINKNKTGLTFGFLISFFHLMWSILVILGIAQTFLDFIFDIHMLNIPIILIPFYFLPFIFDRKKSSFVL